MFTSQMYETDYMKKKRRAYNKRKKQSDVSALPTGGIRESLTFLSLPNKKYFKHNTYIFIIFTLDG
ncbi:hypothetical protein BKP57_03105 [Virgibacillus sp. 6R]|uniref:Uncharacterized protein n=3 Tax=Virgibacillus pantothenticus TaxID=1473 RepID=A0A0L0QU43_VIRPA|nr:hypothetical protein BKP57_03105 [Virgibacillus sp. 6R]KNE22109.1 hypothetical protein AFK71_04760 [Virgibacillus pantothenticus]